MRGEQVVGKVVASFMADDFIDDIPCPFLEIVSCSFRLREFDVNNERTHISLWRKGEECFAVLENMACGDIEDVDLVAAGERAELFDEGRYLFIG